MEEVTCVGQAQTKRIGLVAAAWEGRQIYPPSGLSFLRVESCQCLTPNSWANYKSSIPMTVKHFVNKNGLEVPINNRK